MTPDDEVVDFFRKTFGPPSFKSQIEVVPTGAPIAIHSIAANATHQSVVLFTTGLSASPMPVPAGEEAYSHAELFVELPPDWKHELLNDPQWNWPARWLRKIAQYPKLHATWLGGPVTFMANDDPPKPLADGLPFTTWMLVAEKSLTRSDGVVVQLIRMIPLYSAERDFELKHGLAALTREFDRKGLPFVVAPNRPCLVSG